MIAHPSHDIIAGMVALHPKHADKSFQNEVLLDFRETILATMKSSH